MKKRYKTCLRQNCSKKFLVSLSSPQKYCSRSCASIVNNLRRSPGPPIPKNKLINLYKSGLSVVEIADKTNTSERKINYWLKKLQVPKRSISEAMYLKYNPNGDPFKIKKRLTIDETKLLGMGLGLFNPINFINLPLLLHEEKELIEENASTG